MAINAQQLNEWLVANHQDAIKTLSQQGMTLRFVHGPENYHQDRPSLAVGAEGVGFTFQQNFRHGVEQAQMLANAVALAPAMREAFDHARQQYQSSALPIYRSGIVRGEGWDICNHQTACSVVDRNTQVKHWREPSLTDAHWDAAEQVALLCKKQQFFDCLVFPEFIVELIRRSGALLPSNAEVLLMHAETFGIGFSYEKNAAGYTIQPEFFYKDTDDEYLDIFSVPRAALFSEGVGFEENENAGHPIAAITSTHLNMDQGVMNTMVGMGVSPMALLTFDVQKAQASASADYLADLDMDMFSQENDQNITR